MLGTFNLPVVESTVSPVSPPLLGIVTSTLVVVTGLPSNRSLVNISTSPPLPTEVSGSLLATIVGVTVILTVAVSQTLLCALSQIL